MKDKFKEQVDIVPRIKKTSTQSGHFCPSQQTLIYSLLTPTRTPGCGPNCTYSVSRLARGEWGCECGRTEPWKLSHRIRKLRGGFRNYWFEQCLPKIQVPQEPLNMTLFANAVFMDVIS